MEIVFVASEMVPFATTGGLGDVLGSLPREIAKLGHRVSIFLPKYKKITQKKLTLDLACAKLQIPLGSDVETANIYSYRNNEINIFLIEHEEYFDREELYGTPLGDYPDNDRRFSFFDRAIVESLKKLKIKPDIIHCHDWQSGLIPVYLKTLYQADPFFKKTKTIFTIHNLAYQGNFPPDSIPVTGISWDEFKFDRLEFYGKISFLKGGLVYSDMLTTVSERYAQEIQTPGFGCGLENVLARRKDHLTGIINGINPDEWNPEKDPDLSANFNSKSLKGKKKCKEIFQKENQLDIDPDVPLFGFIGRLVDQKGLDILVPAIEEMAKENWQLTVLGTGDEEYHKALKVMRQRHPKHVALSITFDPKRAKQIYSSCDFLLMPSRFEPCGLGQMFSLRFGTIPIVRETGGLADSVREFNPATGDGNGFIFAGYTTEDLMTALARAVGIFQNAKAMAKLVKNAMACDFSWATSARKYVQLYERAERKPLEV